MQYCRWAVQVVVVVVMMVASFLHQADTWRTDRRPKVFGSKIQLRTLAPHRLRIRRRLIQYHNYFRAHVEPPAANMLAMSWSRPAARSAQRWASECRLLVHDTAKGRAVRGYGPCGQNIFVSTHQVPWFFAINTWYLEKDNFTYGVPGNNLFVVGHYTQLVWHASHQVGCGLTFCNDAKPRPYYNYVCNYCPIGNHLQSLNHPYKRGQSCSACPGECKAEKLCTNACPYGDLWINCKDLAKTFRNWLCHTKTKQGVERLKHCRATCKCNGKITYP